MKSKPFLAAAFVLTLFSMTAGAAPVYESNQGREYLISYQGLDRWGAGFVYSTCDRPVRIASGNVELDGMLAQDKMTGYLTYHLIRALDIYIMGGGTSARLSGGNEESSDSDYGVGLRLNLMDHILQDPILMEDKIRLTTTLQYSETKMGEVSGARNVAWREKYGAINLAIVKDVEGMVLFHPESIALNLGLVYHRLDGYLEYPASRADIEAKDNSYFTAGIEVFWTKRVSIEIYSLLSGGDTEGGGAALHVRL